MRALLFILIIAVIGIIAAAPQVTATRNGVTAKGGQPPAFDVETGSVKVGSKEATVKVPTLVVEKPARNQAAAATNNAM